MIVSIDEALEAPEIVDKNEICNIIASKDAIVSELIVQNGTARVQVGDVVKKGDLLVEGVMEGTYTGIRQVHAEATVIGKNYYEKTKTEKFIQFEKEETGNKVEKNELYLNNFKINFHKGVSNFKNYDTINTSKKIKLFSNFYLPIEVRKTTYIEYEEGEKIYTEDELIRKIEKELEEELESEFEISKFDENSKIRNVEVNTEEDGITLKLIYEIQEEIGLKEKIN